VYKRQPGMMTSATIFLASAILASSCLITPCRAEPANPFLDQILKDIAGNKLTEQKFGQLQEYVQRDPKNSQAHICLGLALDNLGLNDQAAIQFELAVRYGADNPKALVELCKEWIRLGHAPAAIAMLNEGLHKFPNDPEMLYLVGDFLLQQKQRVNAQIVLKKAMDLDPNIPGLPTAYAAALMEVNPSSAVGLASMDLQKNPRDDRALRVRGFSYRMLGEYEKAAKDLQICFDRLPVLMGVAEALAECYYWMGDYAKAVRPAVFVTAFTCFPDVEQSGNISKLLRVLRKLPKDKVVPLVSEVENEIAKHYTKPEFNYTLGKAYDDLEMHSAAMAEYKKAIAIDPKYVKPYYRLGIDQELFIRDYDAALQNYKMAHSLRPWDQEIDLAYMRLDDRLSNKKGDLAWKWKDWLRKTLNEN